MDVAAWGGRAAPPGPRKHAGGLGGGSGDSNPPGRQHRSPHGMLRGGFRGKAGASLRPRGGQGRVLDGSWKQRRGRQLRRGCLSLRRSGVCTAIDSLRSCAVISNTAAPGSSLRRGFRHTAAGLLPATPWVTVPATGAARPKTPQIHGIWLLIPANCRQGRSPHPGLAALAQPGRPCMCS